MAALSSEKWQITMARKLLSVFPLRFKIKLEAQYSGLKLVDENKMPEVDVVFLMVQTKLMANLT